MSTYAQGTGLSDLKLVDPSPAPQGAAPDASLAPPPATGRSPLDTPTGTRATPAVPPGAQPLETPTRTGTDAFGSNRYLAEAAREFDAGKRDQPLWVRAMATAGGDETVARPAYLRARAAALRLAKRERDARKAAQYTAVLVSDDSGDTGSGGVRAAPSHAAAPGALPGRRKLIVAAAVVAVVGVVIAAGMSLFGGGPGTAGSTTAATERRAGATAVAAKAAVPAASVAARQEDAAVELSRRVQELRAAGNWNVLVLHATEWTRKQPQNPDAWQSLSQGYAMLRQFNDAVEAGTRAVELRPDDYQGWQTLGLIQQARRQPVPALEAFEQALSRNPRDVTSLVQAGKLYAQRGDSARARNAFDQALAVNPADVDALCGAAGVAHKDARTKDVQALHRQVKTLDGSCDEPGAAVATAPVTAGIPRGPATSTPVR